MNKTFSPKQEDIKREWYVVDASGQTLGRVATEVAILLRGKHKAIYAPHADTGDNVIIINADKIVVTGKKDTDKIYYHHTMYPQGFRQIAFRDQLVKHPTWPLEDAIRGMLPHNRLGRAMISKLYIYAGDKHPHGAQQPKEYKLQYAPHYEESK
jgi:large subunit ribosomal protein L13